MPREASDGWKRIAMDLHNVSIKKTKLIHAAHELVASNDALTLSMRLELEAQSTKLSEKEEDCRYHQLIQEANRARERLSAAEAALQALPPPAAELSPPDEAHGHVIPVPVDAGVDAAEAAAVAPPPGAES